MTLVLVFRVSPILAEGRTAPTSDKCRMKPAVSPPYASGSAKVPLAKRDAPYLSDVLACAVDGSFFMTNLPLSGWMVSEHSKAPKIFAMCSTAFFP